MKMLAKEKAAAMGPSYSMNASLTIMLAFGALIGIVYMLAQANEGFLYLLSNGLPPLLAFGAFGTACAGLIRNGVSLKNRISIVWLSYSLGMLLWFLGESTWAVYALWYSVPTPFPSVADVFWLAGYAPLIVAMVFQAWPFRDFFATKRMLGVVSLILVVAGMLLLVLLPSAYASEIGQDLASVLVGLAYPLLDVVLLIVALPVLFLFGRGTFWRPFLFITVGLILTFLGDTLFSWATTAGVYYDGSYLELFFHWGYLALVYGFYLRLRTGTGPRMLE
ncbi:MAG: hypothetical protein ABSC50_02090 [Candidatus Bathyarchaeia archaeon]